MRRVLIVGESQFLQEPPIVGIKHREVGVRDQAIRDKACNCRQLNVRRIIIHARVVPIISLVVGVELIDVVLAKHTNRPIHCVVHDGGHFDADGQRSGRTSDDQSRRRRWKGHWHLAVYNVTCIRVKSFAVSGGTQGLGALALIDPRRVLVPLSP